MQDTGLKLGSSDVVQRQALLSPSALLYRSSALALRWPAFLAAATFLANSLALSASIFPWDALYTFVLRFDFLVGGHFV